MNARQVKKTGGRLLAASWLAATGGCVAIPDPGAGASPAVAPRVEALVNANRTYPRWVDFPAASERLPEPVEVADRVGGLRGRSDSLAAETARIEWTTQDPVAFTAEVNRRLDAEAMAPITAGTGADVEAFAEQTRQRGAAPPPVDRAQPPR